MTPRPGVDGFIERFNALSDRVAALENARPQASAAEPGTGSNFFGSMIATARGVTPSLVSNRFDPDESDFEVWPVNPITWTRLTPARSGVTAHESMLTMPSSGLYVVRVRLMTPWWPIINHDLYSTFSALHVWNVGGSMVDIGSWPTYPTPQPDNPPTPVPIEMGWTFLGYGHAIEFSAAAHWNRWEPTAMLPPASVTWEAEIHRLIEGST